MAAFRLFESFSDAEQHISGRINAASADDSQIAVTRWLQEASRACKTAMRSADTGAAARETVKRVLVALPRPEIYEVWKDLLQKQDTSGQLSAAKQVLAVMGQLLAATAQTEILRNTPQHPPQAVHSDEGSAASVQDSMWHLQEAVKVMLFFSAHVILAPQLPAKVQKDGNHPGAQVSTRDAGLSASSRRSEAHCLCTCVASVTGRAARHAHALHYPLNPSHLT